MSQPPAQDGPCIWILGCCVVKPAFKFILARLSESSTIRGALMLLTAAGVALKPEAIDAIVTFGIGLSGLLGVVLPDRAE